jgi:hypothetical protein
MVAGVLPKSTAVTPLNPLPLIFTFVPPVTGPVLGERLVTMGLIEPDQGPLSFLGGRRDQVPDTDVPPGTIPLKVSLPVDAVTFHEPAQEIVSVTALVTDSVTGDVKVIVMEPLILKGAASREEEVSRPGSLFDGNNR